MAKRFHLSADQIRPVATGHGLCIASDQIMVDGMPVRFMYREAPDNARDSGWRFLSGFEEDGYLEDPDHLALYDVNIIANYDPSIVPLLDAPEDTAYEKTSESEVFVEVVGWEPSEG